MVSSTAEEGISMEIFLRQGPASWIVTWLDIRTSVQLRADAFRPARARVRPGSAPGDVSGGGSVGSDFTGQNLVKMIKPSVQKAGFICGMEASRPIEGDSEGPIETGGGG